jgi:DNA-binding beta-propeller fold protein YncE
VHPIGVGLGPLAMAITPDGKAVYVANTEGSSPAPAAVMPDQKAAHVASTGHFRHRPGTVTPIATAINTPGQPIEVGSGALGDRDHAGQQACLRRQSAFPHGDADRGPGQTRSRRKPLGLSSEAACQR